MQIWTPSFAFPFFCPCLFGWFCFEHFKRFSVVFMIICISIQHSRTFFLTVWLTEWQKAKNRKLHRIFLKRFAVASWNNIAICSGAKLICRKEIAWRMKSNRTKFQSYSHAAYLDMKNIYTVHSAWWWRAFFVLLHCLTTCSVSSSSLQIINVWQKSTLHFS